LHHTKIEADIGVAKVIADLVLKKFVPCLPFSEHQPYDLIAISEKGKAIKIQVKYAALKKNGTIDVKFRTSWTDKNGVHTKHYKQTDFDYYAIYCPGKEVVVYVPNKKNCPKAIRFEKTANNQLKYVKWANDYLSIQ
jgi:PD-(D/E)XK endonuclease